VSSSDALSWSVLGVMKFETLFRIVFLLGEGLSMSVGKNFLCSSGFESFVFWVLLLVWWLFWFLFACALGAFLCC